MYYSNFGKKKIHPEVKKCECGFKAVPCLEPVCRHPARPFPQAPGRLSPQGGGSRKLKNVKASDFVGHRKLPGECQASTPRARPPRWDSSTCSRLFHLIWISWISLLALLLAQARKAWPNLAKNQNCPRFSAIQALPHVRDNGLACVCGLWKDNFQNQSETACSGYGKI